MNNLLKVSTNPALTTTTIELIQAFVTSRFLKVKQPIDFEKLKKAGWLCSILAESSNEQEKRQAQTFAILLHLYGEGNESYDKLSYVILSRLGNLLSTNFLASLFDVSITKQPKLKYEFGQLLNIELANERIDRTISLGQSEILTTSFQLDLWNKLYSKENLAISAPTSAGKSFIIQKFIQQFYNDNSLAQALYIVPTKALINQASDDLRKLLKQTVVRTSFIEEGTIEDANGETIKQSFESEKIVYILTPERCLNLLQSLPNPRFHPKIIFIDEIQNIEDTQGRGALFEFVLESLANAFGDAKIITAGPFIKNEKEIFEELFSLKANACSTILPPVFQLRTIVRGTDIKKNLKLIVNNIPGGNFAVDISADFNFYTELRADKGQAVAKTIRAILPAGKQQSIIYCAQANFAESWALKMEEQLPDAEHNNDEVAELIDFISNEIHPKYYLIKCLKKNIAFHHSKLPDIVRKEVEDLFKQGAIHFLYCTSTLLQGVNLPAQNLFITSPNKKNIKLSSFEFGNLIGRAGRISDSLYGVIYCIEDKNEDKQWAEAFYNSNHEKNIVPATRKILENPESILNNIYKTSVDIREGGVNVSTGIATTLTALRHHFLSSPDRFNDYLKNKKLNQEDILKLITPIAESLQSITLNQDILKLNPNVDPLLQSRLYELIKSEGISSWVIIPNGNFHKSIGKEYLEYYKYEELSFYWQFATLCKKLDDVFAMRFEALTRMSIGLSLRQMAYYGYRWLSNISLKEIISEDIKFHAEKRGIIDVNNEAHINDRINKVINVHSNIVTYLLAKYFKLLSDLLRSVMTEEEANKYKFSLSLPTMLELGTTDSYVIQLISAGITRSVALQLVKEFKANRNYKSLDIFSWIEDKANLLNISKVFVRYLKRLNFIKN